MCKNQIHYVCLYLSLSVSLSVSRCPSISFPVYTCLFSISAFVMDICLSFPHPLSVSHTVCLSVCLFVSQVFANLSLSLWKKLLATKYWVAQFFLSNNLKSFSTKWKSFRQLVWLCQKQIRKQRILLLLDTFTRKQAKAVPFTEKSSRTL